MNVPIIKTTGPESVAHQRAKLRLLSIVKEMGMIADVEIRTGITKTPLGDKTFTADVFAFWKGQMVILEVRGYKGHNTKWAIFKDKIRDQAHQQKKMRTVRIEMKDLIGRKKQDDDTIKADILWQLKRSR